MHDVIVLFPKMHKCLYKGLFSCNVEPFYEVVVFLYEWIVPSFVIMLCHVEFPAEVKTSNHCFNIFSSLSLFSHSPLNMLLDPCYLISFILSSTRDDNLVFAFKESSFPRWLCMISDSRISGGNRKAALKVACTVKYHRPPSTLPAQQWLPFSKPPSWRQK